MPSKQYEEWVRGTSYEDWVQGTSQNEKRATEPDCDITIYIFRGIIVLLSPIWLPFYLLGRIATWFGVRL